MVCLSRRIQYRQQSEGSFMPDTNLQTSEATAIPSETTVILDEPSVILSEAKDLSPLETPSNEDTLELDLALEEELIIEDFTIDGICGVY
jgi:mycofactocin precursor